ncbi:GNAT family N-acetyltransferase [Sulfitobacter pseudonitzschiae]|uniref:GNAT family N-acetyltransferase n=1 Tax=Pseudosulfitobacter pseudonitzschiae TaxID=1402135 RepID=A0A9Q2NXL0_9RHOB|nr:GNAT family N-acetyltransferase [Pseudosulfitobacter pseudonitzschiae]MBM2290438.1 GNAT family N-acetyltransferase [Pseudosulfitobacter pseudonitzschiae]MBM2295356.1 GNAT family N-acetyltransferase [Pseudosulfitobacter pseudonitzschiae]MBM2300268.1 GNAT family N-acetyltransferase [Pseudosulfitobacter pseudonitzschiae]MBM2310053.1 GNAT family N-acetyltransferase [Pseudosulfitobacter pseudonitzschiae]MBM2314965.1 GNAT family N-acetyltransferase [Pseudosulfitobacter pseudonitzschiae]
MTIAKSASTALPQTNITFAPFTQDHLTDGLRMSQAVQWPHRAEDWALTLSVSDGVVAIADGQVVGTALCSGFGAVATMNMIIVDAAMRGRGLGRALMERVIALGGTRELRLVATADGLPLYEKLGFQATGRILQHQGIARSAKPELPVATGTTEDIARLAQMDTAASGLSRDALLATIAAGGEVLVHQDGFAMVRSFGRGKVVGPIVAKDDATARALMAEAASRCAGQFLRVDLVEESGLAGHAQDLGLDHAGGGIAMRRAQAPASARSTDFKTYALVSQALG